MQVLTALHTLSLEKCPLKSFAHLQSVLVWLWSFRSSPDILDIHPSSDAWFVNTASHSAAALYAPWRVSSEAQNIELFTWPHLSHFVLVDFVCSVTSRKSLPHPNAGRFCPMFSSKHFVLGLAFRMTLIHFELTFVYSVG